MRTAVIRVNLNPSGDLPVGQLSRVVNELRESGLEVIAPDFSRVSPGAREIEVLLPGDDPVALSSWAQARCSEILGAPGPEAGQATFLSRGTDEDAIGIVKAFGISAEIDRSWEGDEEVATFTISPSDMSHVSESRLSTALEAALNCEVRIVVALSPIGLVNGRQAAQTGECR